MMNRRIPYDQGLIAIVLALLGFGLIMVFTASTVVSAELYGSQTWIFTRQLLFVVLGLVTLMVSMKIDYHFYERRTVTYSLVTLSLVLLVFLLLVPGSNGVQRWIRFGPANFQPSELAKHAVVLFSSFYLATRKEELHTFKRGVLPYLAVVGTVVFLVLIEPDLGTAASIALTATFLLFLGGLRYRYLLGLILAVIPALYFSGRPGPLSSQPCFGFPGSGTGSLWNRLSDSSELNCGRLGRVERSLVMPRANRNYSFCPKPHTDFIYAVVGEEFGFLGCLTVLVLFGFALLERDPNCRARGECVWNLFGLGNCLHDRLSGLREYEHGHQSSAHQRTSPTVCLRGRFLHDHDHGCSRDSVEYLPSGAGAQRSEI